MARKRAARDRKGVESVAVRNKWAEGFRPYYEVLRTLKLPPRGPLRSKQNYRRVQIIGDALHAEKLRQDALKRRNKRAMAAHA